MSEAHHLTFLNEGAATEQQHSGFEPVGPRVPSNLLGQIEVLKLTTGHSKANASATRAAPLAQPDVVDRDRHRRLPGPPFLAARSSRNGPVRPDQRLAGDHLPASRVEGDDATQLRWRRWIAKPSISARRFSFPSERVLERETGFSSEIVALANGK